MVELLHRASEYYDQRLAAVAGPASPVLNPTGPVSVSGVGTHLDSSVARLLGKLLDVQKRNADPTPGEGPFGIGDGPVRLIYANWLAGLQPMDRRIELAWAADCRDC